MKRCFCVFLIIIMVFSLCACSQSVSPAEPAPTPIPDKGTPPPFTPTPSSVQAEEAEPAPSPAPTLIPVPTPVPTPEAPPAFEPYIELLKNPAEGIYAGPSYDYGKVGIVLQATGYTIMEEVTDEEGNLWGRLKSGIGWVDLTSARAFQGAPPLLTANHADMNRVSANYREVFPFADSEYEVLIDIRATAPVTDLELVSLDPFENTVTETYAWVGGLEPMESMLTKLIFWGDFTTYGVFLTDEDDARHLFAIGQSLRNGEITVYEIDIAE